MSLFEFIVGMISIILALAVAQLFVGVSELMQRRARVLFFWPHGIWVVNLFMITFIHWWSLWTFRDLPWNFAMFFYSLLGPSLLFFAATMVSPRDWSSESIDLRAHFLNIRQVFLSVFMIMLVGMGAPMTIGAAFGIERRLDVFDLGAQLHQHVADDMVVPDAQPVVE